MNIAVLSDIHGNHIALRECLNFLESKDIDAYCFWATTPESFRE